MSESAPDHRGGSGDWLSLATRHAAALLLMFGPALAEAQPAATSPPDPAAEASSDQEGDVANEAPAPGSDTPQSEPPEPSEPALGPDPDEAPTRSEPGAGSDSVVGEPNGQEDSETSEPGVAEEAGSEEERPDEEESDGEDMRLRARLFGEYRLRFVTMSDIPLTPLPRTSAAETGRLDQNWWGEQWLRLRGEIGLEPHVRLAGEFDLLYGVAFGELAAGTRPAAWPRDEYGYPGLRLRQLFLEWNTPIGVIRAGQMGFSWGLGIISNGGAQAPVFGDYRYGDLVRRILFATRPAGRESPFVVAVAGDWVAWDLVADFDGRGDLAFQGVLASYYEQGDNRAGAYVAYRFQENALDDELEVFVADAFINLLFPEPSGGRVLTAFEFAYVRGTTSYTRTALFATQTVEQFMAVARLGRKERHVDVILEGGYASGDSNPEDDAQLRATMDPDHRVGLILFPEVLAWMSARSANLSGSPELFGRPARGVELFPTNGGVAGAYYLFAYGMWRPTDWIEGRLGAIAAWSPVDVVDPFAQRARSQLVNFRGGDPTRRDLGFELDGAILLHGPIAEGVVLSGGVEGGVFLPGRAFDDALGRAMDPVGLLRARLGLRY